MTDIDTLIDAATAKETFDVLAAAKEIAYPTDEVTVYTDSGSAYSLHRLDDVIAQTADAGTVATLEAKRDELREAVKASALTFNLRGIAPGYIQGLLAQGRATFPDVDGVDFNTERGEWFESAVIAAHIVDVRNAAGAVDEHNWTAEQVQDIKAALPEESFEKLLGAVNNLSFAASYFDLAVSADF